MLKMLVLQISLSDERHQIGLFCRPDLELWCRHLIRWSLISAQHFKWIRPMPTRLSTNLIKWWGTPDFSLVCRAHPLWVSGRQLHSTNHVGNYLKDVEKLHWINFKWRRGSAQQLKWIKVSRQVSTSSLHCEVIWVKIFKASLDVQYQSIGCHSILIVILGGLHWIMLIVRIFNT